jgi:hypothetical protein
MSYPLSRRSRMSYPPEITVDRNSEEFDELVKHSQLIREMTEDSNEELIINKNFFGNEKFYELFVELFYPTRGKGDIFYRAPDGGIAVNPRRATSEEVASFMDFLLIDKPATMMNFAREKASETMGMTPIIEPRGKGIRTVGVGAQEYAAAQQERLNNNYVGEVNLWNNISGSYGSNNRGSNNSRPEVRLENNGENNNYENNNGSNTTVPSRPRPFTLGNYMPRRSNRRTRRNKSRRTNRKNRRVTRK